MKYIWCKNVGSNQENDEPKYQHEEKFLLFVNMQHQCNFYYYDFIHLLKHAYNFKTKQTLIQFILFILISIYKIYLIYNKFKKSVFENKTK